jgi:hypothetical protein
MIFIHIYLTISVAQNIEMFFSPNVQTGSGTHPASCPIGTGGFISPGVKRPEREANSSPPSSAGVKKEWSCIYSSLYVFVVLNNLTTETVLPYFTIS